ncbi:MAG: aspartate-semialdehyde dehydrogenase [Chloroflexi bacterium]|nr:aspartate-semialdehyde dehydrogenase [Chloroflexota bacterium]
MKKYNIAIFGAASLVGHSLIKSLEQRKFPVDTLLLYDINNSEVQTAQFYNNKIAINQVNEHSFKNCEIAFIAASEETGTYLNKLANSSGAFVIDVNSVYGSEFRMPYVVPAINPEDLKKHNRIIANPAAASVQLTSVINPIHLVNPVKRIIVSSYHSVSETGPAAIDELSNQTRMVLQGSLIMPHVYPHQIAFNIIPEVGVFLDDGYSKEEWRLAEETKRIMHDQSLLIAATCLRMPIFYGSCQSINLELSEPMNVIQVRNLLIESAGLKVVDNPDVNLYPQPLLVIGQDDILVGRIRLDNSHPCGLLLWTAMDSIKRGLVINAIQIAEELIKTKLI